MTLIMGIIQWKFMEQYILSSKISGQHEKREECQKCFMPKVSANPLEKHGVQDKGLNFNYIVGPSSEFWNFNCQTRLIMQRFSGVVVHVCLIVVSFLFYLDQQLLLCARKQFSTQRRDSQKNYRVSKSVVTRSLMSVTVWLYEGY